MIENHNEENHKRLDILYRNHNNWLLAVAFNITRNKIEADDLVSELYLYLSEKLNPKLWYADSFNLMYCRSFFQTRWINKVKRDGKSISRVVEQEDVPYDVEFDKKLEDSYNEIQNELNKLKGTKGWSSAKLFEIYWFSNKTMDEVSEDIGISKSTTFINVKKIKQHLKNNCTNPFKDGKSD